MAGYRGNPPSGEDLLADEEGKNAQTFSEGHRDDAQGQDVTKSARIAAHGFHSLGADQAHADSSTSATDGLGDVACDASGGCGGVSSCFLRHRDEFHCHSISRVWFCCVASAHALRMVPQANSEISGALPHDRGRHEWWRAGCKRSRGG